MDGLVGHAAFAAMTRWGAWQLAPAEVLADHAHGNALETKLGPVKKGA